MMFTRKARAAAATKQWFVQAQQDQAEAVKAWNETKADEFRAEQDARWTNRYGR